MSSFYEYDELESEVIIIPELNNLHTELIKEDIKMQINNPFTSRNNFVETFIQTCEEIDVEDEDILKRINGEKILFYLDTIDLISNYFKLDCDLETISEKNNVNIENICIAMYNFFIYKRAKNIKTILLSYILQHQNEILNSIKEEISSGDCNTAEMKSKFKSKELAIIIANLPLVINYFKYLDLDMLNLIEYTNLDLFNNVMIKKLMETNIISNNFQVLYFSPLYSFRDDIYSRLITKINNGLFKAAERRK